MYYSKNTSEYITVVTSHHTSDVLPHIHDNILGGYDFEFVYVIDGEAIHIVEGERYKVKPGDYFFLDTGLSHGYEIECGQSLSIVNLIFDYRAIDITKSRLESLGELACHYGVNKDMNDTAKRYDYVFHDKDGSIFEHFEMIAKELKDRLPGYHEMIKSRLAELMLTGFRAYFNKDVQKSYSAPISFILNYLSSGYMNDTTLSDLASELKMSVPYLSSKFKEEVGMTFTDYLHDRRISESCKLILNSDESIETVAEYVGYSDSKKFREKFKRKMGVSPREYRRQMSFVH